MLVLQQPMGVLTTTKLDLSGLDPIMCGVPVPAGYTVRLLATTAPTTPRTVDDKLGCRDIMLAEATIVGGYMGDISLCVPPAIIILAIRGDVIGGNIK